jgi:hypothetical protein
MYNDYELDGTGIRFLRKRRATWKEWAGGIVSVVLIAGFVYGLLLVAARLG